MVRTRAIGEWHRKRHQPDLHEDGVHIALTQPWFALHYATTGLNVLGRQINPGQQISRRQALHRGHGDDDED